MHGHVPRSVRCSAVFQCFLDEVAPTGVGMPRDPVATLRDLMGAVAPGSPRHVFTGSRFFLRFLHLHDYILDKAFVACVLCLSRWLRPENWAVGVFAWPPEVPADVVPAHPDLAPLPVDGLASAAPADEEAMVVAPASPTNFPAMGSDGAL